MSTQQSSNEADQPTEEVTGDDKEKEQEKDENIGVMPSADSEAGQAPPVEKKKRRKEPRSEAGSLTSKKLKLHEETQNAIQGLKEGQLSEDEFWQTIHKSDCGSLWKKIRVGERQIIGCSARMEAAGWTWCDREKETGPSPLFENW